jgi:sugar O-acyltransferase (sialic acid O-acetyltransferase NeuD family)
VIAPPGGRGLRHDAGVEMNQQIVIIGAGGFGREVLDVVEAINLEYQATGAPKYEVLGFLDDGDLDHIGPVGVLADMPGSVGYVIGIGSPHARAAIDEQFAGLRPSPVLVHPSATMGREVELGPGTVVCAGARLTNHIRLGRHVHVNLNSTIGHDARLDDYVTLSPLVAVSGNVHLEAGAFLGTGVTLNPGVTVGTRGVIGSGAAVLGDVDAGVTAVGVPARPRN